MERAQAAYVALVSELMTRYAWVSDRVHRRKMAREAARGVLPNSTETKIVVTANARAWRTMLELRAGEGADLEIRRLALVILRTLQSEAPGFFSDFEIYLAEDQREAARPGTPQSLTAEASSNENRNRARGAQRRVAICGRIRRIALARRHLKKNYFACRGVKSFKGHCATNSHSVLCARFIT